MAQDIAKDIHSAASSLASPFTKGGGAMSKLGETASKALGRKSLRAAGAPKKAVHASQMKKKTMTAAEARQHRLMRSRAGR